MADIIAAFLIVVLPLAAGAEWWRMRSHCQTQIREAQARFRRDRLRGDEALTAAKRQIVTLQHQLTGVRLKVQRAERPSPAATGPEPMQRAPVVQAPATVNGRSVSPLRLHVVADRSVGH